MKRFLVITVGLILCGFLSGCSSDTNEDLIKNTINLMTTAAGDVNNIKQRIDEAIKTANESNKNLDLSYAVEATKKLKETGDEALRLKRAIEQRYTKASDEDRAGYVASQKGQLNAALTDLTKKRAELAASLDEAEKYRGGAFDKAVQDLRDKIVEAEGPFAQLSR